MRRRLRPPVGSVTVTYWAGRGRCEPLRCILAAGGVSFQQRFLTAATGKEELAKLRAAGTLAYDQVPLVQIDGLDLVQGVATANYLGTRLGLLPADVRESFLVQHVYASSQDARAVLVGFPFADYPNAPSKATIERVLRDCQGAKGLIGRYLPKWESMLEASGGPFFLGRRPSIADVGVFEACDYFRDVMGEERFTSSFGAYPKVRGLMEAALKLGRLAEHCEVERTNYATWDAKARRHANWQSYATDVRTTLD